MLLHSQTVAAAAERPHDVEVRAFVNDTCVIADEPYFLPATKNDADGDRAKFLPLLGLVIGKLAELFINHEIQASAERMKEHAARKDTHYAVSRHMNLYRVDFEPAPNLSINARLGCMTIVAADFKPEPATCAADYIPKEISRDGVNRPEAEWTTSRTDNSVENQLRRADVCVDGKARAVYEARFEFSKDGTAYRLKDAGYHIQSLLTTKDKGASRNTIYTLKISDPAATDQQEVLSSAWVDIGAVAAGATSPGKGGDSAPWLRVPPLSTEARRNYDEKTRIHQEDIGEIEALKRALSRNRRQLANLDQRIATAGADLLDGLKQERTRLAVQNQAQDAELDARNAEYQELPRTPLEFMPVTIEVAVTESESEKKSRLALADIIGKNSGMVAAAVGGAANGLISRSLAESDLKREPETLDAPSRLDRLRDEYFDALVESQSHASGPERAQSQRQLAVARNNYNEMRRSLGLEQVK